MCTITTAIEIKSVAFHKSKSLLFYNSGYFRGMLRIESIGSDKTSTGIAPSG